MIPKKKTRTTLTTIPSPPPRRPEFLKLDPSVVRRDEKTGELVLDFFDVPPSQPVVVPLPSDAIRLESGGQALSFTASEKYGPLFVVGGFLTLGAAAKFFADADVKKTRINAAKEIRLAKVKAQAEADARKEKRRTSRPAKKK